MGKDTGTIVTIDIPSMQPPTKDTIADNQADPPDTHARGTKQTETSVQGAWKKQQAQWQERDDMVTLTDGDLE